ncbi:hypothetical protein LXT21_04050 [Myxococcus sp. K38C18041901]|uniref:YfiM family protein n=1 Tax=Myxococcus guangdongensis TaxID=2906760 RepID=UPI0020A820F1|nr:hypothetical protein [Myxococcus guangdongensis]MCP3057944.1 hypothetical protein [Myxococcus guangdongensis]
MKLSNRSGFVPCLIALLSSPVASAASGDDWLGPDKPKHFAACFVLAGVGYGAGALLFEPPEARFWTGAGLAMGVGVGKELYDLGRGTTFSFKDLAWDAAGTATGLGVSWLVDRLLFGPTPSPQARGSLRAAPPVVFVPGARGGQEVLVGARAGLDEAQERLSFHQRVHRHQGAALFGVSARDEHGDLAARTLAQTAGGHDTDFVGEPSLGERALQPARQLDAAPAARAAHQALAADEDIDVLVRVSTVFIPHPSSESSRGGAPGFPHQADAPLRGR